jgi:hypothetical protein
LHHRAWPHLVSGGDGENARQPVSRVLSAPMERDDHSSGTHLSMRLTRPTRAAGRERPRNYHGFLNRDITAAPIRSCSRWGLPCRPCYQRRGALLPHRFALARGVGSLTQAGLALAVCFLWHFPWGRPRRPLAGTVFPWSPDFPPPAGLPHRRRPPDCLARGMCAPVLGRSSIPRYPEDQEERGRGPFVAVR